MQSNEMMVTSLDFFIPVPAFVATGCILVCFSSSLLKASFINMKPFYFLLVVFALLCCYCTLCWFLPSAPVQMWVFALCVTRNRSAYAREKGGRTELQSAGVFDTSDCFSAAPGSGVRLTVCDHRASAEAVMASSFKESQKASPDDPSPCPASRSRWTPRPLFRDTRLWWPVSCLPLSPLFPPPAW